MTRPPLTLPLCAALLLSACATLEEKDRAPENPEINPWSVPEPVPRAEPPSRYGNPETYTVHGKTYSTLKSARGYTERGRASWYGAKFHGRRTSSGEPYDMYQLTAAHRSLPLPTFVEVTNLENGRQLIVRVNDRGPFHPDRMLDLSYAAAVQLGVFDQGSAEVEIVAIDPAVPREVEPSFDRRSLKSQPQGTLYFLQLGAFRNMDNRAALLAELAARGLPNLLERSAADANGKVLHRVWMGPYANLVAATEARRQIERMGYPTTIIRE